MNRLTLVKLRNVGWMLGHPKFAAGWLYRAVRRRLRPDEPWLALGAIRFFEEIDHGGRGFEWGSGRSTVWFGERLESLTSIEENAGWVEYVRAAIKARGLNRVEVKHIPIEHEATELERVVYDPLPRYVDAINAFPDGSLDLVIVDGHYRTHCIRAALPKLAPGGLLLVDDSKFWRGGRGSDVPTNWPVLCHAEEWSKCTTIWRKPLAMVQSPVPTTAPAPGPAFPAC